MRISQVDLQGFAALAPMAGAADMAFREICVSYGAAYTVNEMASAKGIVAGDSKTFALLQVSDAQRPCAVQIFGDSPKTMALAAVRCAEFSPDVIDINMGCPAPKIAGNYAGAALMKNPELAAAIVEACARASSLPVTVKMRAGWDADSVNAVELARRFEQAGAAALAVHGRTREQMYAGKADYEVIAAVKRAVRIPVIGSGDVCSPAGALGMLERTGCDMIMVGRAALGRPWLFAQINAFLERAEILPEPCAQERMRVMLGHVSRIIQCKGEYIGIREARKHAAWYIKSIRSAAALRREAGGIESYAQLEILAAKVVEAAQEQA